VLTLVNNRLFILKFNQAHYKKREIQGLSFVKYVVHFVALLL